MLTKCGKSSKTMKWNTSEKKAYSDRPCLSSRTFLVLFSSWFKPAAVLSLFNKPFNAAVHVALIKPNWVDDGVEVGMGGTEWQLHKLVFSIQFIWGLELFLLLCPTAINVNYSPFQLLSIFLGPPEKEHIWLMCRPESQCPPLLFSILIVYCR